jgi:hypothetical protein
MNEPTHLYRQLFSLLSQYSKYRDVRHLKTLAWMVSALIGSQKLSLPQWESYVISKAQKAQSYERRWKRFMLNRRINVAALYIPLVLAAMSGWSKERVYLGLDTTMLWNRYCMIHITVICGGRAVPLLWKVIEHKSASVEFSEYYPLLRKAHWLLRTYPDVMLLADRGFANQMMVQWLKTSRWHWAIRIPCDVLVSGPLRCAVEVRRLWPPITEAKLYHNVRLWSEAVLQVNLVLAYPRGVDEPWAVITDERPTLETLWQYALRFRLEELFLDSKSGVFELEDSRFRNAQCLERLYLVAALAILYATAHGMAVQVAGLRQQVDPHWKRGLSYLKIGLRWLSGVWHKGHNLLELDPLLQYDPQPCFASKKARQSFYDQIWFSRLKTIRCTD